jgi:hypothetical protein
MGLAIEDIYFRGIPVRYIDLGQELDCTGDSPMTDAIFEGNLVHDALGDAIRSIVDQLKKHPFIESRINPIVTAEDFKSAFKCVPKKQRHPLMMWGIPLQSLCGGIC